MDYGDTGKFRSIPDMFFRNARVNQLKVMEYFKRGGEWRVATYADVMADVLSLASALHEFGLKKGDRVAIISDTKREWVHSDLAVQSIGAIVVPAYSMSSPQQIRYILDDAWVPFIFVQSASLLRKFLPTKEGLKGFVRGFAKGIVVFEGVTEDIADEGVMSFEDFLNSGRKLVKKAGGEIRKIIRELTPDDIASIVYTSGTTGEPKGVVQTHGNILSMLWGATQALPPEDNDIIFLWLPLAHSFGRLAEFYALFCAIAIAYYESLGRIVENLKEIKPTLFPSVPRIYDKVYERIKDTAEKKGRVGRVIFKLAEEVGQQMSRIKAKKELAPLSLKLRYSLCDRLVYSKVREAFGGSIRFCISGGAPLSPKIAEFFDTAGIQIVEGYGLTETCPVVSVNRLDKNKFGTVGLPLPNAKFRIAEDGEILIKAPNVAHKGYLGKADETEAMFTEDGWLKTGDIGYIDEEGFIVITGRKKEIIVNSFGENIAPAPIESALSEDLLISSCAVFGDGKPFLVALISPNKEELSKFTRQHGLENLSFDEICKHPTLEERIKRTVDSVNSKLSSAEAIRRFRIVEDEWSAESGEITPTLKVRREIIFKKYKDIINSMYEEKRI